MIWHGQSKLNASLACWKRVFGQQLVSHVIVANILFSCCALLLLETGLVAERNRHRVCDHAVDGCRCYVELLLHPRTI